jgi:hypothetical protein
MSGSGLTSIAQSRSLPAGYVFRAKLILMLNEGASFAIVRELLGTTQPDDYSLEGCFLTAGIDGLNTSHPGQKATG